MIGRRTFLFDPKCSLVRAQCFFVLAHISLHQCNVIVGMSQVRMIGRKTLLFDVQRSFVESQRFRVLAHLEIH